MTRRSCGEESYAQSMARDAYREGQSRSLDGWSNVDRGGHKPSDMPSRHEAEQDR